MRIADGTDTGAIASLRSVWTADVLVLRAGAASALIGEVAEVPVVGGLGAATAGLQFWRGE